MKMIQWLWEGDPVIRHLTGKYLQGQPMPHQDKGYIADYLALYDSKTRVWGDSVYHNKWVCSTYTLLELKYMEISPNHPVYLEGTQTVLADLWKNHGRISKTRRQDMCMSAMLLSLVCYGQLEAAEINEIVDYILSHQMPDGGWNCAWDSAHNRSDLGSVHTTLSVLESLADYKKNGYTYRLPEIQVQVLQGEEFLLQRELFKSRKTGNPIHPDMISFHYPCRWKYDCFRALEYFTCVQHLYDSRMQPTLDLVTKVLEKGCVGRGKRYPGKIHFPLETGTKGRFNTFRALRILKTYQPEAYEKILQKEL